MEDRSFDLLEERVKKAAETLRRLKKENAALAQQAHTAQASAATLQERLAAAQKDKADAAGVAKEREEIRKRIGRIVALLDELEA
jgi:cell division septum initiation protein DivIVA